MDKKTTDVVVYLKNGKQLSFGGAFDVINFVNESEQELLITYLTKNTRGTSEHKVRFKLDSIAGYELF